MNNIQSPVWREAFNALMPDKPNKDVKSRLLGFIDWLDQTQTQWLTPDFVRYRDYLLDQRQLAPTTVRAHLASIRSQYQTIVKSQPFRDFLYQQVNPDLPFADQSALVNEKIIRLKMAIDPDTAPIDITTVQDKTDQQHLRLVAHQVDMLLQQPGNDALIGLRDTAILTLLVCTGIRAAELCALDVDDLRQSYGQRPALLVREGKGNKQRLVPYGKLAWCLDYVQAWLDAANIHEGKVFCGVYKGGNRLRGNSLTTRAIGDMMQRYPIYINGKLRAVKAHDLRRTYAYNLYLSGMDVIRIQQNMGHANLKTTQDYIGSLDAEEREPDAIYTEAAD